MKFVCLEGIKYKNRFYTTNDTSKEPTKLANGTTAYNILGYADTSEKALEILHGPNYNDPMERFKRTVGYLKNMPFINELGFTEKDILETAVQLTLYEENDRCN